MESTIPYEFIPERILDSISAGILVLEKESGKISYANIRAIELCGIDLCGLEIVNPNNNIKLLTLDGEIYPDDLLPLKKVLLTGKKVKDDLIIVRPDGSHIIVEASASPIKDQKGGTIGAVVIIEDITDRKKIQEKLFDSEARFRAFVKASSDVVYRMSPDWNEMRQLHGKDFIPDTDAPSVTWLEKYILPEDQQKVMASIKTAIDTKSVFELEHRIIRADGTIGWTLSHAIPILDKNGKIIEWLGTAKDITEQKEVEETLRNSEERHRYLLQHAPTGMYEIDFVGPKFKKLNEAMCKILAYTEEELLSMNPFDLLDDQGKAKFQERILKHLAGEPATETVEYRIKTKDGRYIWTVLNERIIYTNGRARGAQVVAHDISDAKAREQALLEYNQIVESAMDAIFTTDMSFRIKTWNHSAEVLFGWKAKEAIGKTTFDLFKIEYPTLDGKTTRGQALSQLMENGLWKGEVIYHKKDGYPITVSASISLVKNREGKITGVVAVVHDITPRKMRQKILEESRHDLRHAQAVGKIGSWRLDTQRDVLLWSDENHRIFGVPKGTPMTYESFLEIVHPDDREYVDKKWKAGLEGEPYDIEHRIIVDGEVKWVREKAELEFDKDGTLRGGFGTTQDITDIVLMREKLRDYNKYLQKYSRALEETQAKLEEKAAEVEEYATRMEELAEERAMKLRDSERLAAIGATAGMVGHDIRNPLQSIDGALYLAKHAVISSSAKSDEKKELIDELDLINKQIAYIDHIVADLQDFAKKATPVRVEADVPGLIVESLSMIEVPDVIKVNVVLPEEPLCLIVDPSHMKRVFSNLIRNAVQAMPDGGELTIFVFRKDDDVWIRFEDTGIGIPEEVKPNIFTPLFTTKSKGQGFGLAVCKKLVEAQNGEITFLSKEGKGTTFTIKLPIKPGGLTIFGEEEYSHS